MITTYCYKINGRTIQLESDLDLLGLDAICKSENAVCKTVHTKEYYQGFSRMKSITYILEKKSQSVKP